MQKTGLQLKDKSTQSKREYLFNHVLYGVFFAYNVYHVLPIIVPFSEYNNSIIRLIVCILMTSTVGILFSYYNRHEIGAIQDVVAGIAIYIISSVGKNVSGFIKGIVVVLIVVSIIEIAFIEGRKRKRKAESKIIILSKILRSVQVIRRNVGVASVIVITAIPIMLNVESFQDKTETHRYTEEISVHETYGDEYSIENNIDIIKLIRDNDTFQALDYTKKCEVLRAIGYCEARYLGLCEINFEFRDIESISLLGVYNYLDKTIIINANPIKDGKISGGTSEELLNTVLHECRHCYQYLLSEMYRQVTSEQRNLLIFTREDIDDWTINFEDYKNGSDPKAGLKDYFDQPIERDARIYARVRAQKYYLDIDRLLNGQI